MIGSTLGPYRIDRELGSGGMGKVYAATVASRCPGLDQGTRVALKVLHPHLLGTPGFFKRFLREGEIGRTVRHENVVQTFECDALGAQIFLVMEYVEGQTLRDLLDELERVPEELCRHIAREVCKGLSAIHAAGVIHRDMKPDNVLITEDHVVKVMDLGVARLQDEALRLSQTGAFVGSIHYAAPECFHGGGKDVDGRADLHALGLVLYELATGVNPYLADDVQQILQKVLRGEPRRLGDINPQLSAFFEEVVHCLLAKKPGDRFATADELLGVLEEGEDSDWWHGRARTIQATTKRPIRRIRIPRETAVYGRESEIAKLRGLFDQARAGDGQVVLLEGEAGIGKSRLVDELLSRLQREGDDLNLLFGSYPPGGAATASGAFSSAFHEHFGEDGSAPFLPQTPLLVPAFDALLTGDAPPPDVQPLTKDSLQTCFVHAMRSLGSERPTVVLIDDLHFAPEEARALFASLAMAVPGHRVLLIGSTRPGVSQEWVAGLTRLPQTTQLSVPRLGPKDLIELLQDSFKSQALASTLAAQIALKSDGNPFFAFEIIRGLREGQFITQEDDGTWVSTRVIDDIQIPSSVLDLVNARVAGLTEDERNLLDMAACWGYEFDPVVVGDALGLARIPTLRALGQIERQHRLARSQGRTYVFDHHQVQEALYGALNEYLREEYHSALASALATRAKAADQDPEALDGALCVDLCEHYLKGSRGEEALRYLEAGAAHLTEGYLHAQVVALTERALAVPNLLVGTDRAKALLRLADPLDSMGRRERQEECVREAERLAEEAEDDDLRGRAATALGGVLRLTTRNTEAEAAYRRSLTLAQASGDRTAEAQATGNLGIVFQAVGRLGEAREYHELHLSLSREIGNRLGEAFALGNLGMLCRFEGRLLEARECHERSLALCREIGHRRGEADSTGNLGIVFQSEGRLREARQCHERRLSLCRETGYRAGEAVSMGHLGVVLRSEGRLREAREYCERHLSLSREIGHREGESISLHNLGDLQRELGESARAQERLCESLLLSEEIGYRRLSSVTRLLLGVVRAEAGDEAGAHESLVATRDLASEVGMPNIETLARCHLACLPGGDAADALASFSANGERLADDECREVRYLLWKATGDRVHLAEAKRLLDESMAQVDDETRESILTNLRVPREIVTACREQGLSAATDGYCP